MDKSAPSNALESLWRFSHDGSICCECRGQIASTEALARTFTIKSLRPTCYKSPSQTIQVPCLSEVVLIFERHLECLIKSVEYITISHVWHEAMARLQLADNDHEHSTHDSDAIFLERPVQILRALAKYASERTEIWHDYISVPQWSPPVKSAIIAQLPRLYFNARWTVAVLDDVRASDFHAMRYGQTPKERIQAISRLCTAKWFSRLWTMMEFAQSGHIRVMVQDAAARTFCLMEHDDAHRSFVQEMGARWQKEEIAQGSGHPVERMAQSQYRTPKRSPYPWQLGPLTLVQRQNMNGVPTPFAISYCLLAGRDVTIPRDFFHAMVGVLEPNLPEPLNDDPQSAMLQLAGYSLKSGDFSPLLMGPIARLPYREEHSSGYQDARAWGLGRLIAAPEFPRVALADDQKRLTITAERLGKVQCVHTTKAKDIERFKGYAQLALLTTGLSVDDFVSTVGVRFYGQEKDKILERLSREGRQERSLDQMRVLKTAADPTKVSEAARSLAESMGLSNKSLDEGANFTPIDFCQLQGGTLHHSGQLEPTTVGVTCRRCEQMFFIRVARYVPAEELFASEAVRIPGLRYHFTHGGGVGFLLREEEIVGRFVWGIPTCECEKLGDVSIVLDVSGLPVPR